MIELEEAQKYYEFIKKLNYDVQYLGIEKEDLLRIIDNIYRDE